MDSFETHLSDLYIKTVALEASIIPYYDDSMETLIFKIAQDLRRFPDRNTIVKNAYRRLTEVTDRIISYYRGLSDRKKQILRDKLNWEPTMHLVRGCEIIREIYERL